MLSGRVAMITAGASGIGAATARRFCAEGASVVIADMDLDAGSDLAESLPSAVAVRCDVRVEADCREAVGAAAHHFGGLDILVNNAGIGLPSGTVVTTDPDAWDQVFSVNVRGGFLCSKYAVPHLRRRGGGVILFTSSGGGLQGTTGQLAYCASKAAVIAMVRTMALDHGPHGIRVNCICPGATLTPSLAEMMRSGGMNETLFGSMVPLGGRMATAEDQADVFAFLAGDDARFVTGQFIAVDGGQSSGMFLPSAVEP